MSNSILVLRKSRKAFLIEYGCAAFLLGLLGVTRLNSPLPQAIEYGVLGLAGVALFSAEISRLTTRYKIREDKMEIINGFIKQDKKNVYYHPLSFVPDLNIKQGRIGRILDYGSVYLKAGGETTFEIKDVNSPHEVLEMIENMIGQNRGGMNKIKED